MLDAADILIDVHPVIHALLVKRPLLPHPLVACIAREIPRAFKKCIKRVGLAYRVAAAFRAFAKLPARMRIQRIAFAGDLNILRKPYGQI